MRLKRLKLAGFKSFVDPTTIHLPSPISAVVGPNGCGKSNVVDAIRWVLGEGSAKHLRGGHMADFIFNGSDNRKPMSRASAELVFDNREGKIGGPYAAYDEISVRRTVDRDGQSEYHLNNSRCRRKDITDLFLGTGLGPRAYAIIEQGMIARIVEASPTDRRYMLEEAAGVTRYKERRRETTRRLEQTRENMDRVADLQGELAERLERLEGQAATAQEYKRLKQEQRQVDHQLLGARYRDAQAARDEQAATVTRLETELEEARARVTEAQAEVERLREARETANEAVNAAQGEYYARESDIAALEREREHARQQRQRLESEREQARSEIEDLEQRLADQRERIAETEREQESLRAELERLEAAHEEAAESLEAAREERRAAEQALEAAREAAREPEQQSQLQEQRREQAEQRLSELTAKREEQGAELERAREARAGLDAAGEEAEAERAEEALEQADERAETAEKALEDREGERERASQALQEAQHERERTAARLDSLRALEEAGEDLDASAAALLEWAGGGRESLVGEWLEVAEGWEQAVEEALGEGLQALASDSEQWPRALEWARGREGGRYPLARLGQEAASGPGPESGESLLSKVAPRGQLAEVVREWLRGVFCAPDLDSALERAGSLAEGQWLVTPEGHRVGRHWAVVHRGASDSGQGWLQRKREIERLEAELAEVDRRCEACRGELEAARSAYDAAREEAEAARAGARRARDALQEARERAGRQRAEADRLAERETALQTELEELERAAEAEREKAEAAAEAAEEARSQAAAAEAERSEAEQRRDRAANAEESAREAERKAEADANQARSRLETLEAGRAEAERTIEWAKQELERRQSRLAELESQEAEPEEGEADIQQRLEEALEERTQAEAALRARREEAETAQQAFTEAEQRRVNAEQTVEDKRGELEGARLQAGKLDTQLEDLAERMREQGTTPQGCLAELPEEASAKGLERRRTELQRELDALGTVNLAAIEEYEEVAERKGHIDEQYADLEEAITTLENAIQRIDVETRQRFRETFEAVDGHFRELFPRLFGGGRAYLAMTEDDPLETGVDIMAQPPGKKVRSIQLLSGGEKALTAVALTFALFQLNPAPFCVLDEVDAPLDDANVGRYGALLEEMSDRTQFIVITHNKVTMERCQDLVGVTMAEPGVSRVVSVNVAEGAEMAQG